MFDRLKRVFEVLEKNDVKYVVVGGVAAVVHGVPRSPTCLEILVEPTVDNAVELLRALEEIGFTTATLTTAQEVVTNEVTVFKDRVRIDVLTVAPGIRFKDAWKHKVKVKYENQEFNVLSRDLLIKSKRSTRDGIDFEDARLLELNR